MKVFSRWYAAMASTLGVALLACGGLLLLLMLHHFVGAFRLGGATLPPVPRTRVLWLPSAADDQSGDTLRRLEAWKRTLGAEVPVRRGPEVLDDSEGLVVAVPDARRMDASEALALHRFVEAGGAVLLTGSLGVREQAGVWCGYGLMRALLEVQGVVPLARQSTTEIVAAARGPVSAPLPPGAGLALLGETGLPGIPQEGAELAWLRPDSGGVDALLGASRRLEIGRGRLVWTAPGPEHAREGPGSSGMGLDQVLQSALAWAAGEPVAEVLPQNAIGASGSEASVALGHADWRALIGALAVSTRRVGTQRLLIAATNRSDEPVKRAALRLYLPQPVENTRVATTLLGQRRPKIRAHGDEARVELLLPMLPPGSHAWLVDWDPYETSRLARVR